MAGNAWRWRWVSLAWASLAMIAVGACTSGSSPAPRRAPRYAIRPVPSGLVADLVIHNGDTVIGSSQIEATPGKPVRFCDPHSGGPDLPGAAQQLCAGINAVGVDLHRLTGRFTTRGTVYGLATLTGTYRDGTLSVTSQGPPAPDPEHFRSQFIPCVPPAGGWVPVESTLGLGNPYRGINLVPAERYQRAHRQAIVRVAALRASPTTVVAYILTPGDTAQVRAALSRLYPNDLCVATSRFTASQISTAQAAVKAAIMRLPGAGSLPAWDALGAGDALGPDGQLCITLEVPIMTADLARFLDSQLAGIVEVTTFLQPLASTKSR